MTVDSAAFARMWSGAAYLERTHGRPALQRVVPAVPDGGDGPWSLVESIGIRRGCAPREARYATIDWTPGVPGLAGGRMWDVEVTPRRAAAAGAVRVRLVGDTLVADATGWRARGSLRGAMPVAPDAAACDGRLAPESRLRGAEARVDLRDAAGTLRAQLVVTRMLLVDGAPGEVRGLLMVP